MQRLQLHHLSSGDIHPAFVKAALAQRGLTLTALARRHDKEASYFRSALQNPFPKAMRLIARALSAQPHQLWPSLFDEDNQPIRRLRRCESSARSPIRGGRRHR
ncbi:MAG: helix-turn-helix domain-containing protein [Reyranella sp.]|nr:helix-turn-helix domain-containing protein [Reyranella sp.]